MALKSLVICWPGSRLRDVIFAAESSRAWLWGPVSWLVSLVSPQKLLSLLTCLCSSRVRLQGEEQGWGYRGAPAAPQH